MTTQEKEDDITYLKHLIEELKVELETTSSERDRALIEARLSAVDAEAAKSFSKQNYTSLLNELFEEPSKKLRKYNQAVIALTIITLASLTASFFLLYDKNQKNSLIEQKIDALASKLSSNDKAIIEIIDVNNKNNSTIQSLLKDAQSEATEKVADADKEQVFTEKKVRAKSSEEAADKETLSLIEEQKNIILDYINTAKLQKGFPEKYQTAKKDLAQLYIIVMQHANKDSVLYESYLAVMDALDISAEIKPNTIDELVELDRDFLHANYAAYIITSFKRDRSFRYRDSDRQFSTYYNSNAGYDLGAWQIVNKKEDYSILPQIFLLNIERIAQQIIFNQKEAFLEFPEKLFYHSYDDATKNQAIANLLGGAKITSAGNTLTIDTQSIEIYSNKTLITKIQTFLADKGLMDKGIINGVLGPKTRAAIAEYRKNKSLDTTRFIDIHLLKSMKIPHTVTALTSNR